LKKLKGGNEMEGNKEICDWCGEGVHWVNSLGYCKKCMEWHIKQHHKESKEKEKCQFPIHSY